LIENILFLLTVVPESRQMMKCCLELQMQKIDDWWDDIVIVMILCKLFLSLSLNCPFWQGREGRFKRKIKL